MNQYDSIMNLEQRQCVLVWSGAVDGKVLLERQAMWTRWSAGHWENMQRCVGMMH